MTQNETQNPATPAETPESAAQAAPQTAAPEAAADTAAALAAAQAEIAALKDRILRTAAEGENLRKRLEREKEDAAKYASGKFARDVLTVADNLRRALDNAPKHAEGSPEAAVISGVEATERELLGVFERHGIARIDPKGQKFDPNLHQAMFEIEDPTVPSGTVVQVVAAGYVQHGRLLRAAMVGVSKGGPQGELQPGAAVNTQA